MKQDRARVVAYSVLIGIVIIALWQAAVTGQPAGKGLPGPVAVGTAAWQMLSNPFYDNGPNDKGIGLQFLARDRKSTRLNSSHIQKSRMPSSA